MPDKNVDNEKMANENGYYEILSNENDYDEIMRVTNDDEEGINEFESADENLVWRDLQL